MGRDNKGQVIVEFALVGLLLFILIFGLIDLAFMFYVNLTMQHAVRQGTRYAVTGQSDLGTDRRSALITKIQECSNGLYDKNLNDPKEPQISVIHADQVNFTNFSGTRTASTANPGNPNDIIVVSLTYKRKFLTPMWTPFFPNGEYTFTVKSTMKNESFD